MAGLSSASLLCGLPSRLGRQVLLLQRLSKATQDTQKRKRASGKQGISTKVIGGRITVQGELDVEDSEPGDERVE